MILELKEISKQYQIPGSNEKDTVLNNISLNIKSGESVAIIGPSGSGKSTLLNIAGSLDQPTSGEVILNGLEINNLKDKEISMVRNQNIGFIFQLHHLLPQLNLLENVLLPLIPQYSKEKVNKLRIKALDLIDYVGLSDKLSHVPGQMSVGECQRVAVVRALINDPKIVLADEPTGSLDQVSSDRIGDLLVDICKDQNMAMMVVTHSKKLAAKMGSVYNLDNATLLKK